MGQKIDLGPVSLHMVRLLIAAGAIRVVVRGERLQGGFNGLDRVMIAWAVWAILSSFFHTATSEGNPFIFRVGLAYNALGIYFLIRIFCRTESDVINIIRVTALLLVPVALEMLQATFTGKNLFSVFGGVRELVTVRGDRLRAQGPFAHGILAGTVGAVCFPLMVGLYKIHRNVAVLGILACVTMVIASGSSGPVMSLIFGICALLLWRWRHLTRQMRLAVVFGYLFLDLVMKAPAYYLIARIDLTGSSTGWHRARLIETGLTHLNEWWLAGTDYTRHWMPTGVSWSPEHTDITNHYLQYGVIGGLPLIILFIAALSFGYYYIGHCLRNVDTLSETNEFFLWAVGAALLTHTASCISISYFDQSYVFLFMNLALIGSLKAVNDDLSAEVLNLEEQQSMPLDQSEAAAKPIFG